MSDWNRRSVMATGAVLAAGSLLASAGVTGVEDEDATDGLEEPDGWSSYRGGPGNAGYLPIDGEFEEPDTVAWEYEASGPLAVVDGTVYLNDGGEIHALEEDSGEVEWTADVDGAGGTAAVAGETLYVAGDRLTALEADSGEVEWTADLAASSPTVAHGQVFTLVDDRAVYALEPDSGDVDWDRETVEMETDDESESEEHTVTSIVVADGLVHAKTSSTEGDVDGLAAFDPETGETAWTWSSAADPDTPSDRFGGLMAKDGTVYSVRDMAGGGKGVILDADTGERIDSGRTELTPAVGETAWIATTDVDFSANEPAGERLWSESGATSQWGPTSIVGETVVAIKVGRGHDSNTELVGFDVETGDERWTVELEDDNRETGGSRAPILSENAVYVRSQRDDSNDVLVAFRPSDEGDEKEDEPEDEDGQPDEGEDESDEGEDESDEGESDCPADDTESDCPDDDPADDEGGSGGDEGGSGGGDDDDGTAGDDDDGDTGNGDDGNETDDAGDDTDADDVPGFTTGAGVVGGALGLEWLRRKAGANDSADVDEPVE